jgi:hypothetical protein
MNGRLTLIVLFLLSPSLLAQTAHELTISNWADIFAELPGVSVQIEQGQETWNVTTDVEGYVANLPVETGSIRITLGETSTKYGSALGMDFETDIDSASSPSVDWHVTELNTTQPIAIPVLINSAEVAVSDFHARWAFGNLSETATFAFQAQVAVLLTDTILHAYAFYAGISLPGEDHTHGILIRCQGMQLPEGALAVEVDCNGHGYTSAPVVDTALAYSGGVLPAPFSATVVNWEDGYARVLLDGELGNGDNILLFREDPFPSEPGAFYALLANTMLLPVGSVIVLEQVTDCVPEPPGPPPGFDCTPTPPNSSSGCPQPVYRSTTGPMVTTHKLKGPTCGTGSAGQEVTFEKHERWWGGFSVKAKIRNAEVGASGNIEQSNSETITESIGPGNGCGQCVSAFQHRLWRTNWYSKWSKLFGECFELRDNENCADFSGMSTTKCDRECGS